MENNKDSKVAEQQSPKDSLKNKMLNTEEKKYKLTKTIQRQQQIIVIIA